MSTNPLQNQEEVLMASRTTRAVKNDMTVTKGNLTVSSTVVSANPVGKTTSAAFTRKNFEDALDKVSRPERTPRKA